jgi:DNA-directed RNA polymerase II subunit RPB1
MGIVQDSLLGISILSKRDSFIEMDAMMNLMMWLEYNGTLPPPAILKPKPLWTGKQVLSLIIPKVNFIKKENGDTWACRKDDNVFVKNGELVCGVFRKPIVGAAGGGMVQIIWKDCGHLALRDWISNT